jgi:alpha-1,2-mannosyltransferase
VLLALPVAHLDYPEAFLLWSLVSLAALVVAWWLMARQFAVRIPGWSLVPLIALVSVWYPFRQQMIQGQINLLLLFMLIATWTAHRTGWYRTAGAVLGTATAVKLFPGLLFVYFVLRRQWLVAVSAAASLTAITFVSVLVFGSQTYVDYVTDVLPGSEQWQSHWHNTSLMALWTKLFDPGPAGGAIVPVWRSSALARVGGLLSCAVVVAVLMRAILRAEMRAALDQTFGMTITAMLLVSPITWSQNLVLLVFPIALLWMYPPRTERSRWACVLVVLTLFIPPQAVWRILIPGGWPDGTVSPWQTLTALSFQCYAVLGLFALQLVWSGRTSDHEWNGPTRVLPACLADAGLMIAKPQSGKTSA